MVKCPTCSKEFSSVGAFDGHRVGEFYQPRIPGSRKKQTKAVPARPNTRRCLSTEEMLQRDFAHETKNGKTMWYINSRRKDILQKSRNLKTHVSEEVLF